MLDEVRFLLSLEMLVKNGDVPVTQIEGKVVYGCERYVVSQQTLIESQSDMR